VRQFIRQQNLVSFCYRLEWKGDDRVLLRGRSRLGKKVRVRDETLSYSKVVPCLERLLMPLGLCVMKVAQVDFDLGLLVRAHKDKRNKNK
jgi:hypothetical protein